MQLQEGAQGQDRGTGVLFDPLRAAIRQFPDTLPIQWRALNRLLLHPNGFYTSGKADSLATSST